MRKWLITFAIALIGAISVLVFLPHTFDKNCYDSKNNIYLWSDWSERPFDDGAEAYSHFSAPYILNCLRTGSAGIGTPESTKI